MSFKKQKSAWLLIVFLFLVAACTTAGGEESAGPAESGSLATELPAPTNTAVSLTDTPVPDPTATPQPEATDTAMPPTNTPESEPTAALESTVEPAAEMPENPEPLFPIGSTADLTASNDPLGIEGAVEYTELTKIVIRDFVFLAAEAPGVDIRLGVGDDFSDEVAVSLKDITGQTYEGRNLTLNIPATAFDSRPFDSIGVFCFDTDDLFDWALIEPP